MVARAVSAMAPTRAHGTPGPDRGHRVDGRLAVAAARATVMARLAPADKERIVWFCRRSLSYRLVRRVARQPDPRDPRDAHRTHSLPRELGESGADGHDPGGRRSGHPAGAVTERPVPDSVEEVERNLGFRSDRPMWQGPWMALPPLAPARGPPTDWGELVNAHADREGIGRSMALPQAAQG